VFDASDGFASDEIDGGGGSDVCGDVDVGDFVVDR
jgi:hypothetical protein